MDLLSLLGSEMDSCRRVGISRNAGVVGAGMRKLFERVCCPGRGSDSFDRLRAQVQSAVEVVNTGFQVVDRRGEDVARYTS
mmetsp:Transcript_32242/g.65385  ORF Transcript_32242/g.65385 Transcript_32242/m.65385 type:complete len:81 (+) Transcript_32242:106-348(+)